MAIPSKYKLSPSQRQVLAVAENAQTKAGSHFGIDTERATVRELAKRKLMKITSETKRTPRMGRQPAHGPELWAAITATGSQALVISRDPDSRRRAVDAISVSTVLEVEGQGYGWVHGTTPRASRIKLAGLLTVSQIERLDAHLVKPVRTAKKKSAKKSKPRVVSPSDADIVKIGHHQGKLGNNFDSAKSEYHRRFRSYPKGHAQRLLTSSWEQGKKDRLIERQKPKHKRPKPTTKKGETLLLFALNGD